MKLAKTIHQVNQYFWEFPVSSHRLPSDPITRPAIYYIELDSSKPINLTQSREICEEFDRMVIESSDHLQQMLCMGLVITK